MGSGRCWDREWNNLCADVVGNIAERLSLMDYIQFGRVCMAWKSALSGGLCLPKSPQAPWLMVENRERTSIRFFDIYSGTKRAYNMKFPRHAAGHKLYMKFPRRAAGHKLFSTGGPWLVTISPNLEDATIAWNPFVDNEVYHFPSILTLPVDCRRICARRKETTTNTGRYEGFDIAHKYFVDMIKPFKFKFESDTDITMATIAVYHRGKIAFARAGDASWTPVCDTFPEVVEDAIFHQGSIYAVVTGGKVRRWDAIIPSNFDSSREVALEARDEPYTYRKYFAAVSTKLVMVWCKSEYIITEIGLCIPVGLELFELDSSNSKKAWKPSTGLYHIGDSAIFVDLFGIALIVNYPRFKNQIRMPPPLDYNIFTHGWFMPKLTS